MRRQDRRAAALNSWHACFAKVPPTARACLAGRKAPLTRFQSPRAADGSTLFSVAAAPRQFQTNFKAFSEHFFQENVCSLDINVRLIKTFYEVYEIAQSFFAEASGFRKSNEMRTFFPSSRAKALTKGRFAAIIPTKRAQRGTLRGFAAFFLYSALYCTILKNHAKMRTFS